MVVEWSVSGPSGVEVEPMTIDEQGRLSGRFLPSAPGEYSVNVLLDGEPLAGSPYLVDVGEGQVSPSMCVPIASLAKSEEPSNLYSIIRVIRESRV
jgi:hypothetical protein